MSSTLAELNKSHDAGVVALYTVVGTEEVKGEGRAAGTKRAKFGWAVLVTPRESKAYPIDVRGLEEDVFAFRAALSSDKLDPRPLAEKLYAKLFRQTSRAQKQTLEADLKLPLDGYKDRTLMWSLDGVLRYVPMAALHDGKKYLVEEYQSVTLSSHSAYSLGVATQPDWQVLGLGVSEARANFAALPGVKTELETIVREPNSKTGILKGAIRLNQDFKKQQFLNAVSGGEFPVVHVASHYSFNPALQDASFLLVGDGRLTFGEMKADRNLFGAVDLLTLSACDTAMSANGEESEGFAFMAQELGAKSVLASLWKVSDKGTPELMIRFYRLRADAPAMPKGVVFRRAQLSFLHGDAQQAAVRVTRNRWTNLDMRRPGDLTSPPYIKDERRPYAHPHYWSSFVLIGNWK